MTLKTDQAGDARNHTPAASNQILFTPNISVDLLRRGDVGASSSSIVLLQLCHAAQIESMCRLRVEPDRLVIIRDGAVIVAFLKIDISAVVKCSTIFHI